MFGSHLLDVIMGLVFVYILLSIISSGIKEAISSFMGLRSRNLAQGIRSMLNDPEGKSLAKALYEFPLIKSSIRKLSDGKLGSLPSYIPSKSFVEALLGVIAPVEPEKGPQTLDDIRAAVNNMQGDDDLKKSLLTMINNAEGDLRKFKRDLEDWFDATMDRVSGWYKRKSQLIIAILSLLLVSALNADTIMIVNTLWNNPSLRSTVVQNATQFADDNATSDSLAISKNLEVAGNALSEMSLFGWESSTVIKDKLPTDFWGWLKKILGLLLTTVGVSLGAPFWFGVINKITSIRATGNVPATAQQGSEPAGKAPAQSQSASGAQQAQ